MPVTREAFRDADDLPSDQEVVRTFESPLSCSARGITSLPSSSHNTGSS